MKSMTGYGRGESATAPHLTVECASVNRKSLEVSCQMPRDLSALEPKIRDLVQSRFARGRVNVVVLIPAIASGPATSVDLDFARDLVAQLRSAAAELELSSEPDINRLLSVPGFLRSADTPTDDVWPALHEALNGALDGLAEMRTSEGTALLADLTARLATVEQLHAQLSEQAPRVVVDYRDLLKKRLENADLTVPIDETRLASEIAIFAERSDVSEELTRLGSHFDQFREKLASEEPGGRALEFLTQEIFRELNTLGAKAGDSTLSRLVVDAKVELDKMREQILNVE
ncbi:MAG: YicC/YloC family endoribonuclease [Chthoniobacterales bacterium]